MTGMTIMERAAGTWLAPFFVPDPDIETSSAPKRRGGSCPRRGKVGANERCFAESFDRRAAPDLSALIEERSEIGAAGVPFAPAWTGEASMLEC